MVGSPAFVGGHVRKAAARGELCDSAALLSTDIIIPWLKPKSILIKNRCPLNNMFS